MRLVRQQDRFGCVVACLAMVLGETYDEVKRDIGVDVAVKGCDQFVWHAYLAKRGFAVQHFWHHDCLVGRKRDVWPLAPWATIHLCMVDAAGSCGHLVVMAAKGSIFDPASYQPKYLRDYAEVMSMTAVIRI